MEVETELDPLVESDLRLLGGVHVAGILGLHPPVLVIKNCLDNFVADSFSHDVFRVFGRVENQLLGDVRESDPSVGERDGPDGRLDHVVMETEDERVRVIRLELFTVVVEDVLELLQIPGLDGLRELKVRHQGFLSGRSLEGLPLGDVSEEKLHRDGQLGHVLLEAAAEF